MIDIFVNVVPIHLGRCTRVVRYTHWNRVSQSVIHHDVVGDSCPSQKSSFSFYEKIYRCSGNTGMPFYELKANTEHESVVSRYRIRINNVDDFLLNSIHEFFIYYRSCTVVRLLSSARSTLSRRTKVFKIYRPPLVFIHCCAHS